MIGNFRMALNEFRNVTLSQTQVQLILLFLVRNWAVGWDLGRPCGEMRRCVKSNILKG